MNAAEESKDNRRLAQNTNGASAQYQPKKNQGGAA